MAFQYGHEEICDEFEASFLRFQGDPLLQSEGERKSALSDPDGRDPSPFVHGVVRVTSMEFPA